MRFESTQLALPSPVGDGTGVAQVVKELIDKWVQVGGTFTANVTVQGTIDGTNWLNLFTTAVPDIVEVPQTVKSLRVVISGFAANTSLKVTVGSRDARSD